MHDSGSNGKKSIQEMEALRQHKLKTERLRRKDSWQKKIQPTIGVDKPQAARRTGIDVLGDVPWGTHLCVFYQDKQDLINILVPYFKEGLENNEFCVWITSEPLNAKDAEQSLRQAVNNLDDYIEKGQIEILDYNQWYTKSGSFYADKVIQGWMEKYEQAGKRKFDGLRITGNTLWLQKKDWRQFAEYERTIDEFIGRHKMLAICTYCLDTCGASQVVDVVSSHIFAVIKRQDKWELVENFELRNTKRALQNAIKQWETTFNTTQDSIILIDPDFTILKANMATSDLLGKPLDDIVGSKCYELFHGTNAAPDICPHRKAKETKKHEEAELYIPDKDIWIAVSIDPILDDNGNISGTVHVARNITEKKKMREALRENQEKMRSLLELSPDFIIIVNPDHKIQFINRTAHGNSVEEVIGKSAYEFIEPLYHKDVRKALSQAFSTGQSCSLVVRGIDHKGKIGWFENRLAPIKKDGSVYAVMVVSTDITKRRKAEEKLKQSREFLANTINALDDSFFVKDEEHRWTIFNDAACKAIGRPREELIGKSDYDIFPKEQADVFWEKDNLVFETGETSINEEEITWQGKLHTISTKKSLFKDFITGKRFIVGTVRDITERKQIEKTLRESEQKYRALVEQSLHGIVILQDFRIVFANAAAMEISGLTIDEAKSLTLEDMMAFIPLENRAATLERLKNRFAGKNEPGIYELRLVHRNGEEFWLNLSFSNIEYQGKFAIQLAFVDITDQKRMEEALRRSEKRFRDIFENTAVGIYCTTPDGRILMANPALVHMLRYSSFEELSQRNLEEEGFEPQYRRSMFKEEIERKGRIVSWESIWITRDGKKLYVIENARAVRDEDDKILYYEGTSENITERKKAEEALCESERRYRAIFEQAADSIVLIDAETGELVEFNDRTHQNLGYTREEFQNLKIPDFEVIESTEEVKKHLEKIVRTGTDTFETKHRTKDDEIRDVQIRSRAISIREKDFVQSIWRDITDSKKAEAALAESEGKFRNLAEGSPNMIFINKRGRILYANKKCEEIMGYNREEFYHPDFDFMTLIAPELRQLIKTNLGRHMKGEEIKPYEYGLVTKEGERLEAIITTKLMKYNGEDAILGTITDITERKQAEEKLREYQEQLKSLASELTLAEERERHRIATELHDEISQSLFISKMKLEEIQKSGSGKTFDDTLDEINNSLGRIIASMRSLTFDLSSPILYEFGFEEAVAEWLNERVEKKYGIATEFEDDGLPKPLDDDIRVILFRNVRELLINVVKHAHAKKIKVSIKKVDSQIRICVEDDGLGFDSAKAESMITNKKAFGLFSIRERLEHFGGNLKIESESGCGCRITITSPLSREEISKDKQA